jgi:hypothetical protein
LRHRLVAALVATSMAAQPALSDVTHYYRHLHGDPVFVRTSPPSETDTVRGDGPLDVYGPVQVRARPGVAFALRILAPLAEGGVAWSSVGTPLPDGLTLSADGSIEGVPTGVGSAKEVRIQATDASGKTGTTKPFAIDVKPLPTLSYQGGAVTAGSRLSLPPLATDLYGTQSWRIVQGALPIGMSLDAENGRITGTPEQKGAFPQVVVEVVDSDGAVGRSAPFALDIASNLTVAGLRGSYQARLGKPLSPIRPYVTGNASDVLWSLAARSAALPAGLSLDAYSGGITGTPTEAGTIAGLSLKAQDVTNGELVASDPFSLRVAGQPTLAVDGPVTGRSGTRVTIRPTATDLLGNARYTLEGTLPGSLALDGADGTISGVLSSPGTAAGLTLRALDLFDGARASSGTFRNETWPALSLGA